LTKDRLTTLPKQRRAFTIIAFIAHSYVWCDPQNVRSWLPAGLSVPWVQLADLLELKPVVCCASVVSWNWRKIDQDGPLDLSNLAILQTFAGSLDEAWFYLITAGVEARAVDMLRCIPSTLQAIEDRNHAQLRADLQIYLDVISDLTPILRRMYEHCDPYVFYWKIHPYLAGWSNQAKAGLPHGLLYRGVDDTDLDVNNPRDAEALLARHRQYAGGSAAQSTVIQVFDILLGIQHYPTGLPKAERSEAQRTDRSLKTGNYLLAMRQYMPGPHRRFLEDFDQICHLREYVQSLVPSPSSATEHLSEEEVSLRTDIYQLYNACVERIGHFRDAHIQMVTRYIISPARRG
ncbi:Indoleamine 2,3-dioxygenase, partial [Dimargaris cristalligena]